MNPGGGGVDGCSPDSNFVSSDRLTTASAAGSTFWSSFLIHLAIHRNKRTGIENRAKRKTNGLENKMKKITFPIPTQMDSNT